MPGIVIKQVFCSAHINEVLLHLIYSNSSYGCTYISVIIPGIFRHFAVFILISSTAFTLTVNSVIML